MQYVGAYIYVKLRKIRIFLRIINFFSFYLRMSKIISTFAADLIIVLSK